jgi:predicted RNA-binding Zn ribbon-like protein
MATVAPQQTLVGGHVALDLVNTLSWRLDPVRLTERLADFRDLVAWAVRAEVVEPAEAARLRRAGEADPAAAAAALTSARRLREALYDVLNAQVTGTPADPTVPTDAADPARLQPFLIQALRRARPRPDLPLRWTVAPDTPLDLVHRLTLAAVELLQDGELLAALKLCEGPGCGWLFLDRSRSHTRRWCSSGDCGNRERVRRHYARTRT